ncbi:MAG: hypothetical protein ACI8X5_000814 [Planctomycetota bacterium]|jgi:hypothetical protein
MDGSSVVVLGTWNRDSGQRRIGLVCPTATSEFGLFLWKPCFPYLCELVNP